MARSGGLYEPLVRWVGGKRQILDKILPHLPYRISTYVEPFCGGAAVFWALHSGARFERAVLADVNADLIGFYRALRDDAATLILAIETIAGPKVDAERYYHVRAIDPGPLSSVERAARFIFLNKTSFNGIYRVDKNGRFNTPWGKLQALFDFEALHNASTALKSVSLELCSYKEIEPEAGSTIYCDPPYYPIKLGSFLGYDRIRFGPQEHAELATWAHAQRDRGCTVIISNSDLPEVRVLYPDAKVVEMSERRAVAASGSARKAVASLLLVLDERCS